MAKLEYLGGNPKVVVATPDVTNFRLRENTHDFIIIASDGVFDKMRTDEVVNTIWNFNDSSTNPKGPKS